MRGGEKEELASALVIASGHNHAISSDMHNASQN
jgi:hypothetical protein